MILFGIYCIKEEEEEKKNNIYNMNISMQIFSLNIHKNACKQATL